MKNLMKRVRELSGRVKGPEADIEDRKETDKGKKEESEDEDAIDMFDEIPDNEETIMYQEYFDKDQASTNNEGDE